MTVIRSENIGEEVERRIIEALADLSYQPDTPAARAEITTRVITVLDAIEEEGKLTPEQNLLLLSNSIRFINQQLDGEEL